MNMWKIKTHGLDEKRPCVREWDRTVKLEKQMGTKLGLEAWVEFE